jgi:hypothetical protein
LTFIHHTDNAFRFLEKLLCQFRLKDTTTGKALFLRMTERVASLELGWQRMRSVATGGDTDTEGERKKYSQTNRK